MKQMAKDNRLWGAESIRGELLKLGVRVCLAHHSKVHEARSLTAASRPEVGNRSRVTTQDRSGRVTRLQVTDLFFRPLFAFFIIELKSRKVIQVGVTRSPTDAWVVQHLREATPYGQAPKYLIRDNDHTFGSCFARVATTSGVKLLTTPYHAPRANAICERCAQECPAGMP